MKKLMIALVVSLILLASCSTLGPVLRPTWIDNTPIGIDVTNHVGAGSGDTKSEAKAAAYRNVLGKMGADIGYELYDLYYRELLAYRGISAFGSKVADEFYYEANGIHFYYVMVTTATESLLKARSSEYISRLERESRIDAFLEEAIGNYKENKDVAAAESVLKAVAVSLEGEMVGEEYQPQYLVSKAVEYLDRIEISVVKNRRGTPADAMTFRIVRHKGLIKPVVEEAVVECDFSIIGSEGGNESTFHHAKSDTYGRFVFNRTNPYMLREGEIRVSILLDEDLIYRLRLVADDALLEPIFQTIAKHTFVTHYAYKETTKPSETLIALAEYDFDGNVRKDGYLMKAMRKSMEDVGVKVPAIYVVQEEDSSEIEELVLQNFPDYRYIIICMIGASARNQVGRYFYTEAEGRIILLDRQTEKRTEYTSFFYAEEGETQMEADEKVLEKISLITSNFVLQEF